MAAAQTTLPTVFSGSPSGWDASLYAFLAEKQRRSGSLRTPDSYYRTLRHFFGSIQKSPDQVSPQDVFCFAHGVGLSGREPSPTTVSARICCLSSFYKFLIRLDLLTSNPCDPVDRPRIQPSAPRGLTASQVQQLVGVIPDSVKGRRDRAIVLTLVLTGRRRSEVINLNAGDISFEESAVFYLYLGKGGVRGRRELPRPALVAIQRSLADVGKDLSSMQPSESLWQAGAGPSGVTASTFYNRFRTYLRLADLPPSGLHVLRHTAAKLRRDVGESVESVSQFLDHSSLAVTTTYLRRLEGQRDVAWQGVACVLGLS
ncbi:MAG: tyrosine-type recombinase/integrase [Chloroflexi bacterium]|nr:tyrosine-type recombinase/integrase [Chloroflexota bacterium]